VPNTVFDLGGALTIDTTQLGSLSEEAQSQLEKIDGQQVTAKINVEDGQARSTLSSVEVQAKALGREIEKPRKLKVDTSSAKADLTDWRNSLKAEIFGPIDQDIAQLESKVKDISAPATSGGMLAGRSGLIVGGGMVAGGLAATGGIAYSTIKSAYATDLMEKSTQQVFGAAAEAYEDEAGAMADATGFLTKEIEAAQIAMNKTVIQTGLESSKVQPLTGLAGDLAATSGLPQYANNIEATTSAIVAGLKGTDGALLDFGIRLDDLYVMSLPVNASFKALGDALTPAQKAQAAYNAIMYQTAAIQGKASEASEDMTDDMRRLNQSLDDAKESVGEALIPVAETLANFVSKIPPELMEAGIWTGMGVAIAVALGGAVISIDVLIASLKRLGTQAMITSAETAIGGGKGGLLDGLLGKGKGLLGKGAAAGGEAATAAGTAGASGMLAELAAAIPGVSGVGTVAGGLAGGAVLALPAIVAAGLSMWYGSNEVKNAEAALDAATKLYEAQERLTAKIVARDTGKAIAGLTPEDAAKYAATSYNHYGMAFNAAGQRLPTERNKEMFDSKGFPKSGVSVNVTLKDQTGAGVKATQLDTRSYSPSAY
jgi:hypothetical protein